MNVSRKTAFAAGAVMALVLGSGTAYASTGGDFHLGRTNHADRLSVLVNSHGSALMLRSKSGRPPLRVNRRVKVPRLNADLVDGQHARSFALTAGTVGTITATGVGLDNDSNGIPEEISAIATCPAGSELTGGGAGDFTENGVIWFTGPVASNSWQVAVTTDNVSGTGTDVKAFALCYNPRKPVTDARTVSTRSEVLSQLAPLRHKLLMRADTR